MRLLKDNEKRLIRYLLSNSKYEIVDINSLKVEDLNDGGMGSLYFVDENKHRSERKMLKSIKEIILKDTDGVDISITLNIDEEGHLFELDIWKVDFTPLNKYPDCK